MLPESILTADGFLSGLVHEITVAHFHAEMASISEWVLRDGRDPDRLFTVFVAPRPDGQIETACSCPRGTRNEPCPHALLIVSAIRSDQLLYDQLFRDRSDQAA